MIIADIYDGFPKESEDPQMIFVKCRVSKSIRVKCIYCSKKRFMKDKM